MKIYSSAALLNVTGMAAGHEPNLHSNDFWHWFKHASPVLLGRAVINAEIPGIQNETQYVSVAREICRKAAVGFPGSEVKVRESASGDSWTRDYLVWYQPGGQAGGLFIVVRDHGYYGELITMFPPTEGRSYFDEQQGAVIQ